MIHLGQHVDCVGIEVQIRIVHHAEGEKLVAKSSLAKDKLRSIGAIKTVNAISSTDTILERNSAAPRNLRFVAGLSMSEETKLEDEILAIDHSEDGKNTALGRSEKNLSIE
jgi:hypothetical protein